MKSAILFAILATTFAKPNGFYHQEYNYQTSSSSYKNHELQHRNDDEGFYSKDGDLEGRVRPHVNAHSQHSEYVNPKLQHGYRIGTDRTSSFGQLHAQNRYRHGEPPFDGPDMGVAYAAAPIRNDYGVSSNLREVTASLQAEMEREIQRAVYEHHQRAQAYGGVITQAQIEADRRVLEEDLRRNVTMRLQEALKMHYGNQGIRGAYSYSILNGRLQPTANYNNEELADLTRQMEENLMRSLNQQVQTYYTRVDTQVHTQRNTYRTNGVAGNYPSAMQQRPPVYHNYPPPQPLPQPHPVPAIPDSITTVATRVQTELNEILNKILEDTQRRYFSENSFNSGVNYESILVQLQNELRANITFHFDDQIKRAYGYSNYASKYSMEDIENLRRQIETNLITKLNRDFNTQREKFLRTHQVYISPRPIPANHVYYPVNTMNYQTDISHVQRQLQEQLSRQLQDALMRQSYRQAQMYSVASNVNPQANYQATLDQLSAELNRNLTRQIEILNTQQAHQYQSGAYEAQLANMRSQLQQDLMRQLQQGLQQSYSRFSSWSSSSRSSSNYRPVRGFDPNLYPGNQMGENCMMGDDPSVYQTDEDLTQKQAATLNDQDEDQSQMIHKPIDPPVYQKLSDEKNLVQQQAEILTDQQEKTEDLEKPRVIRTISGAMYQKPEPAIQLIQQNQDLTQQIEDDDSQRPEEIVEVVPAEVQEPISRDYRPIVASDLTQQQQTEDLTQQTLGNRRIPSQTVYTPYSGPPVQEPAVQRQYTPPTYQQTELTPPIPVPYRPYQPLTQQTQDSRTFTSYRPYRSRYEPLPPPPYPPNYHQEPNYEPIAQQSQKPQVFSQTRPYSPPSQQTLQQSPDTYTSRYSWTPRRQYPEGGSVGQRVQYYENLQRPHHQYRSYKPYTPYQPRPLNQQNPLGQQIGDSNLYARYPKPSGQQTQEIVDPGFGVNKPNQDLLGQQIGEDLNQQRREPYQPYQNRDLTQQSQDLTQQIQDPGFGKLQIGNQQNQDLTQQTQDLTEQNPSHLGQQTQDDLTQQIQDPGFGKLQIGNQQNRDLTQQTQDDLTQQIQDPGFGKLQIGNQHLTQQTQDLTEENPNLLGQQHEDDSTQQILDPGYGRPQIGNQQHQDLTQQTQDLTEQNPNFLGQQTEDDLTLQMQEPGFEKLQVGNQQNPDLTQQTQQIVQPIKPQVPSNQYLRDPNNQQLAQQTRDLMQDEINKRQQYQDLGQQTEDFDQQNQDLTQQTEDLTQQTQDIDQHNQDLTQQTQDLTQQTEDNDQPINKPVPASQYLRDPNTQQLAQQTRDLMYDEINQQQYQDLTQQTQDFDQQNQDLTQQTEDLTHQQQTQVLTQQTEDLTHQQQTQDLTQQTEDLTQQVRDLTQQTEDLTQQTEDLDQQYQDLTQQTQDLTQQTEDSTRQQQNDDLTQQTQDFDQQNQDLTQQTQDLTQQTEDKDHPIKPASQYLRDPNNQQLAQQTRDLMQDEINQHQQYQDWTQQTEDLNQQYQDLTQQTEDLAQHQQAQDLTQQTEDLTQQQQNEDLTQQTQDLTQQTEDIDQPIEPQTPSGQNPDDPKTELAQQVRDLIKDEQNQKYEPESTTTTASEQQNEEQSTTFESTDLENAERESQRLVDLLRKQQQNQRIGPMQPVERPVYGYVDGHPVQIGTTRGAPHGQYQPGPVYGDTDGHQGQIGTTRGGHYGQGHYQPHGRNLIEHKGAQEEVEGPPSETVEEIKPVEPQVASEVQQVGEPVAPPEETTTPKPGFWSKWGSKLKNKLG